MLEAALHREGDGHGHRAPGARCWRSASFGRVVVYCHRNRVHGHRPGCRRRPRRATRRALRESRGSCNVYVQGNSATVSACNVYVHESRRRIPWPGRVASAVTVRAGPPALTSRTRSSTASSKRAAAAAQNQLFCSTDHGSSPNLPLNFTM